MLRFPNPGSTIDNFVRIYGAAFEQLRGKTVNLDDIVRTAIAANLATSSGYMGEEALARSTRADRSRDPLYNLIKMYAELFRMLGWIHPTSDRALSFRFTRLGEQVAEAGRNYWPILDECALGLVYPNPLLSTKGHFDLRPFAFIVKVMGECGGHLSRDEMIIGPLNTRSDRTAADLAEVVSLIGSARESLVHAQQAVVEVAKVRGIQVNTLYNYTRWPIALMRDSSWVQSDSQKFTDGRKYSTWSLTEKGWEIHRRLSSSFDIRLDHLQDMTPEGRIAVAHASHWRILERSGFNLTPVAEEYAEATRAARESLKQWKVDERELLFSPFQSMTLEDIDAAFPQVQAPADAGDAGSQPNASTDKSGRNDRSHLFSAPEFVDAPLVQDGSQSLMDALAQLLDEHGDIQAAASAFADARVNDTQAMFYPLVAELFKIIGFKSEASPAGANYRRWDACVWVGDSALPVEIKSPTEELMLSTKAVRQALENKVVMLSRGPATSRATSSLVVGYRIPNERGDMSNLIDDVFSAYEISLGVIDLATLAHLAILASCKGAALNGEQLSHLRGFFRV